MRNLLIATMLGSTAMAGAAFAQQAVEPDATQQTDPAMQTEGAQTAPEPMLEDGEQTAMTDQTQGGFMTWQDQDQMIASNLMGSNVWGAENEVIGNVDDLLLDRDGRIIAVIVGVGGFLGIGDRDVAISTDQLEFVLAEDAAAGGGAPIGAGGADDTVVQDTAAPAGAVGTGATNTGETVMTEPMETDMTDPAEGGVPDAGETDVINTGETAIMDAGDTDMADARWGWTGSVIDHIQVNFTREQLEAAPPFETIE